MATANKSKLPLMPSTFPFSEKEFRKLIRDDLNAGYRVSGILVSIITIGALMGAFTVLLMSAFGL